MSGPDDREQGFDIPFTCRKCGHMLPQSYEDEDGVCFLCTPLTDEQWDIVHEAQRESEEWEW